MVAPLVRELPQVAAVHEVNGLATYRTGRWRQAAQSLELARQLKPDPTLLPVLADCYRALKRWDDVDTVWRDVKAASPPHDVMAEARIVVASSYADRGDLRRGDRTDGASAAGRPSGSARTTFASGTCWPTSTTAPATRCRRHVGSSRSHPVNRTFADVRDRLRALGR